MSALSVPNLLSPQAKPSAQANSTQAEAETPFSSVLQQKVKDSQGDKSAQSQQDNSATASPAAAPTQPEPAATSGDTEQAAAAVALVNGEYAQGALQQLLPWLQAMQGQTAQNKTQDTADSALLPQTGEEGLPQAIPALTTEQRSSRQGQDLGAEAGAAAKDAAAKEATTAGATANLAATPDTHATDSLRKPAQEGFDTALQGASQRIDSALQQAATHQGANQTRSPEANRLQAPLGTSQWQQEFTDRIQFMSRHNEGRAELVLTPPQLGRIEVTLNVNGDQASALFVSANPEVRTALEGAMDRLREALANNGIALGQAQVGAESSGQSGDGRGTSAQGRPLASDGQEAPVTSAAWTRHSNNMLDVFA